MPYVFERCRFFIRCYTLYQKYSQISNSFSKILNKPTTNRSTLILSPCLFTELRSKQFFYCNNLQLRLVCIYIYSCKLPNNTYSFVPTTVGYPQCDVQLKKKIIFSLLIFFTGLFIIIIARYTRCPRARLRFKLPAHNLQ